MEIVERAPDTTGGGVLRSGVALAPLRRMWSELHGGVRGDLVQDVTEFQLRSPPLGDASSTDLRTQQAAADRPHGRAVARVVHRADQPGIERVGGARTNKRGV